MFRKLKKQRFMRYQGVYLYFPIANIDDPVSILACCLNTEEMKQSLESAPANAEIRLRLEFNK